MNMWIWFELGCGRITPTSRGSWVARERGLKVTIQKFDLSILYSVFNTL